MLTGRRKRRLSRKAVGHVLSHFFFFLLFIVLWCMGKNEDGDIENQVNDKTRQVLAPEVTTCARIYV